MASSTQSTRLSPLTILVLSNVLEMLTISIILPSYPKICESFGITAKTRGFIISIYSLFQVVFLSSPVLGRLSDVLGRVTMLKISAVASMGTYFMMMLATDQTTFMLARAIPGLFKSSIATSQAYLTDISNDKDRAKNLGILGAGYGVAFVFGPAVGGVLMSYDLWLPVKVALLVAILNLLILFTLPEPNSSVARRKKDDDTQAEDTKVVSSSPAKKEENGDIKATAGGIDEKKDGKEKEKHNFWYLLRHSRNGTKIAGLLARKLCVSAASGLFETSFVEYCARELGLHGPVLGLLLSYLGVLSVLNNAVIIRLLTKYFKNNQILLPAIIGQIISMLAWGYVRSLSALLPVLAGLSICGSIFTTLTSAELSRTTPHDLIGTILGVSYAIETFCKIVAPPLSGTMLEKKGAHCIGWCGVVALSPCVLHVALEGSFVNNQKNEKEKKKKEL